MSTTAAHPSTLIRNIRHLPGGRFDHVFFAGIAWLMLITVFVGFAPTYYLAGWALAPLPSLAIHVHAMVFSCWILLLIAQTSLVTTGRVRIHRQLGVAGFFLACLMVVVGPWAAIDMLVRGGPVGRDPKAFFAITLSNIVAFAVLVGFAFRARFDPTTHKRLILLATTALMTAAISRWPLAIFHHKTLVSMWFSYVFVLMLVLYDLWSSHKLYRGTLAGSAFLIILQQTAFPLGRTAVWHSFANWIGSLVR